jgi:hypothetical protein
MASKRNRTRLCLRQGPPAIYLERAVIRICSIACIFLAAALAADVRAEQIDYSQALEDMVTCGEGPAAVAVGIAIEDEQGFRVDQENENFYLPVYPMTAFGFDVAYVGLSGVMFQSGPNLTVGAAAKKLTRKVSRAKGWKFECDEEGCTHEISDEYAVVIVPHPDDRMKSIIICAYLGL